MIALQEELLKRFKGEPPIIPHGGKREKSL
jgi:hypothetical protein